MGPLRQFQNATAIAVLLCASFPAAAQIGSSTAGSSSAVPVAAGAAPAQPAMESSVPRLPSEVSASTNASEPARLASLTGMVSDPDGALVPGARVSLTSPMLAGERTTLAQSDGSFRFEGLAPGEFHLSVTASGLQSASFSGVLSAGQNFDAQTIVLPTATASDSIEVTLSRQEVAEEQVRDEEQQRVIGIVPNYFVSYSQHPAPLDARQKFNLGEHVILDPTTFLFSGVAAGVEQAKNTFPGYGQGTLGYGKRYGAALANASVATLLRGSVFPALLRQDPRYFYKGTGSIPSRSLYALGTAFFCKGDNGRWQPNYSGVLAEVGSGAIANLYYPASSRDGAALTFENAAVGLIGVGVGHLLQEFLFRRLTHSPSASSAPIQ